MENLLIKPNDPKIEPYFEFYGEQKIIKIGGISTPEDSKKYYEPGIKWLKDFSNEIEWLNNSEVGSSIPIKVEIRFLYLNSTSAKFFKDMILIVHKLSKFEKVTVSYKWYYESDDLDMEENAEELQEMLELTNFTLEPVVKL